MICNELPRGTDMSVTLAILAGGEGRRMGGAKALLRIGGAPILEYLLDRWVWDGPTLLVTAPGRERPPGGERFTRETTDATAGEGPLRGVLTALAAAETDIVVVATCDMPRIERRQLAWLVDALAKRLGASLVMLSNTRGIEPFPLAIRRAALPSLTKHFDRGNRSAHSLMDIAGAAHERAPIEWSEDVWTNLNSPADVAALGERAS